MIIDEADSALLRKWIMKRLEDISDADSDVLADYVLALIRVDETDEQIKANCLENLDDFLREHTASFVDDVFTTIRTKSYLPNHQPAAISGLNASAAPFQPPTGPGAQAARRANGEPSRKRARETSEPRDTHHRNGAAGGERNVKQRRGAGVRGGRGGGGGGGFPPGMMAGPGGLQMAQQMRNMQGMQRSPPPGFPPFDPNNPMSVIMAMQAMGLPPPPAFPGMPMPSGSPPAGGFGRGKEGGEGRRKGERCKDYDTKGFCALGGSCPYEHGGDHFIVPGPAEEYDPQNAALNIDANRHPPPTGRFPSQRGNRGDRGRGTRGFSNRGGSGGGGGHATRKARASFSAVGPNHDPNATTIVVEQIPEDHFSEEAVRSFFAEFGSVTEVSMQPYKRLALVTFADHAAARRAWDSPKVIFDNRFVKVYWYKPDPQQQQQQPSSATTANGATAASPTTAAGRRPSSAVGEDPAALDPAVVAQRQAEAQRAHEEKAQKMREAAAAREELDRKLRAQTEERRRLMERLAAKTGSGGKAAESESSPTTTTGGNPDIEMAGASGPANGAGDGPAGEAKKSTAQTEALRAKLAELEAEAERIGLSPQEDGEEWSGFPARGRGSWRGRGGGSYRGRGSHRGNGGGYRGRGGGAAYTPFRGGAVKRLDNRPKKVAVLGIGEGSEKDEALRQFLFNTYEIEAIEPHPERADAQVVAFRERYMAEKFLAEAKRQPSLASVELAWVQTPLPPISPATASGPGKPADGGDVTMGESNGTATAAMEGDAKAAAEEEYDVADDEDRWMGAADSVW